MSLWSITQIDNLDLLNWKVQTCTSLSDRLQILMNRARELLGNSISKGELEKLIFVADLMAKKFFDPIASLERIANEIDLGPEENDRQSQVNDIAINEYLRLKDSFNLQLVCQSENIVMEANWSDIFAVYGLGAISEAISESDYFADLIKKTDAQDDTESAYRHRLSLDYQELSHVTDYLLDANSLIAIAELLRAQESETIRTSAKIKQDRKDRSRHALTVKNDPRNKLKADFIKKFRTELAQGNTPKRSHFAKEYFHSLSSHDQKILSPVLGERGAIRALEEALRQDSKEKG